MTNRKKRNQQVFAWAILVGAMVVAGLYWNSRSGRPDPLPRKTHWQAGPQDKNALDLAWENYGKEVQKVAEETQLPADYLLALITLECSGRRPAGSRFEPGVFKRLAAVKTGERRKYEQVRTKHLEDATDEALTNLATSWGPFQLMGYKCIGLDVQIRDLRGDSAVRHAIEWIDGEYGKYLRRGKFKDAFHIHNTGRKYPTVGGPRTHDPRYVEKGLERMKWFQAKLEH